jgi:carboxyl-terminal processing protease
MNHKFYSFYLLFLFFTLKVISQDKKIDHPVKNFQTLWETFDKHYAFFDLKKINWDDSYKKYRSQVNDSTTNDSLFAVCSRMIGELNDGHVGLMYDDHYFYAGKPPNFLGDNLDSMRKLLNVMDANLTELGFTDPVKIKGQIEVRSMIGNMIEFSSSSDYGYIRISAMNGISRSTLKQALDQASKRFNSLKGIIIDVRFNRGGYDEYSYLIADYFTDIKRIGHHKYSRKTSGHNDFTKLETWFLKPMGTRQSIAPVVVLTSNRSASATEVLALAMRQLPYVTIIGDTTYGIFSDMYEGKLPNGWNFGLSNEKYFDTNMKCYEGTGISPDIPIQNSFDDLAKSKDPVIYKAIVVLNQKNNK